MPYIQEIKRTSKSDQRSFKIAFHLGMDSNGKPITRTSIWIAPSELNEKEVAQNIRQTATAYEKFLKNLF